MKWRFYGDRAESDRALKARKDKRAGQDGKTLRNQERWWWALAVAVMAALGFGAGRG